MKYYGNLDRVYNILEKYSTEKFPKDMFNDYQAGFYDGVLAAMGVVEDIKADIILLEEGEQL